MRVVVTGGAGFIGHHVVAGLVARGAQVTVIDNLHRGSFERAQLAGAALVHGNVLDSELCGEVFRRADCVVHLAARSQVMSSQREPQETFDTNVLGAWAVAREAIAAGARHLIFASSREVYGNSDQLPVAETAVLAPHNVYGASKAAAELLLGRMPGLPLTILRLSNVIGPGDSGRVVPRWLHAAQTGAPLTVFGGTQLLDVVPVGTVVEAILRSLDLGPIQGPINIGSGVATPILELAKRILALTGSTSPIVIEPARDVEVDRFCAETTRMTGVLGVRAPADPVASIGEWWCPA
jgi:UDP-glucose 4-epimerase